MKKPDYTKIIEDEKVVNGFNYFPPNIKEISQKEFVQSFFFMYHPTKIELRQVTNNLDTIKNGGKGFFELHIYWHWDGSYVAIHNDFWEGTMRFFRGEICNHEYQQKNLGNCYNAYTCKKCGFYKEVDSSD